MVLKDQFWAREGHIAVQMADTECDPEAGMRLADCRRMKGACRAMGRK